MKITHVHIENFCNLKEFDADFSDKVLICGRNETGKSSVRNAIFWTLTGKLADGSAADGIRPKDKNGKEIDFIDTVVELTTEHNGSRVVFKKTLHQKWVSHRGFSEKQYQGDEVIYQINGIDKKQKDYQQFIEDIVNADTLLYGTNANAFLNLDTKKRRAILMQKCGEISLESIVASEGKYDRIKGILLDGTIDELIARARKNIKAKEEMLKMIPVRIDEVSKQIVDIDVAELELQKNQLLEDIKKIDASITNHSNKARIDELGTEEMSVMMDINEVKRQASTLLNQKRHELNQLAATLEIGIQTEESIINEAERQIEQFQKKIEQNLTRIAELKPKYENIKASQFDASKWVFDENTTICFLCGQRLPNDKIEALKSEFEAKKAEAEKTFNDRRNEAIKQIADEGNSLAKENASIKENLTERQAVLSGKKDDLSGKRKELAALKSQLALLPLEPDYSVNKEYQTLNKRLAEIVAELKVLEESEPDTHELEKQKNDIEAELTHIENQIARSQTNADIENRIAELTAEQKAVAQAIADEECVLDLLNDLSRAYIEQTTESINRHFGFVRWIMFKENKTCDGFLPICEPTVNGVPYSKNLNHGNQLLANMDIEKSFQDMDEIKLFLSCDDCESIDEDRIPEFDRQAIFFRRTDDERLMVKTI